MQRWKYKRVLMWWKGSLLGSGHYEITVSGRTLKGEEVSAYLDRLGEAGWELVSVVPEIKGHGAAGSSTDGYMMFFKCSVEETV
jgi:hypothetical protein